MAFGAPEISTFAPGMARIRKHGSSGVWFAKRDFPSIATPFSNAGAQGFDVVLLFKCLVLKSMYNLSDAQTEMQKGNY
jgi:hypothetical protein